MMIGLIRVAGHGYLAQQIVQMFITLKNFCLRLINIVSTSTLLNTSIQSRTFSPSPSVLSVTTQSQMPSMRCRLIRNGSLEDLTKHRLGQLSRT